MLDRRKIKIRSIPYQAFGRWSRKLDEKDMATSIGRPSFRNSKSLLTGEAASSPSPPAAILFHSTSK